jgi:membrane-associated protein
VTINDQLLAALGLYGLPALFIVVLITSVGVPLPSTFALIAAGAFVQLGDMNFGWVIGLGIAGALLGDQIGYAIGRWGGRPLAYRLSARIRGQKQLQRAEETARKWGAAGIFFSRWLITPLSPWLNIVSGITSYPYIRFLIVDIPGEIIWVVLYVLVGEIFSDRVQAVTMMLGNLSWALLGAVAAALFGWRLFRSLRNRRKQN